MRPDHLLELDAGPPRTPDVTDAPPLDPVHEALLRAEFRLKRAQDDYRSLSGLLEAVALDRAEAVRGAWLRGAGAGAAGMAAAGFALWWVLG
jgi:hypothetical protein